MVRSALELPQNSLFPIEHKWQRTSPPICCSIEGGFKRIISIGVSAKNPTVERSAKFARCLPVWGLDGKKHSIGLGSNLIAPTTRTESNPWAIGNRNFTFDSRLTGPEPHAICWRVLFPFHRLFAVAVRS